MARYPIYADSYAGIGAQLANQETLQQQAIQASQERLMRERQQQQQQANYERQMAYRQAMDQEALKRQAVIDSQNERYLNWQMGAGARVNQDPAAVRTDLFRNALDYVQQHGVVPEGTPPDLAAHLAPIAESVRPELAQRHKLFTGAADVVNRRNALRLALQRLDADIGKEPPRESIVTGEFMRSGTAATTKKLRSMRDKYAAELAMIEPKAKVVESDPNLASGLQFDPQVGGVVPIYTPKFMQTNAPAATRATRSATNSFQFTPQGGPVGYAPPMARRRLVIQNGNRFEILPDGTISYVGPAQ